MEETQSDSLNSISKDIVTIRGKEDMLPLIRKALKPYIHFEGCAILRYEAAAKLYRPYVFYFGEDRLENTGLQPHLYAEYPEDDDSVTDSNTPVVQDIDLLLKRGNQYISFVHSTGMREVVTLKLRMGNELIGLFVLLSKEKNVFTQEAHDLLTKISYPVAFATANIMAREEITKSEEERTLALSLGNEIAAATSREDLFSIVNDKIKKLFSIKELGFLKVDDGGETYRFLISEVCKNASAHPDFEKIHTASFDVHDAFFTELTNSDTPIRYDIDEVARRPNNPPYVQFWMETGIEQIVTSALRVGGVCIGAVLFVVEKNINFQIKSTLLKGLCSQLAVAVSSILANETLRQREEEKTRLLDFSNAMASVRDKRILGKILKSHLRELFGIEDYVIHALSKDKKTHRPILFDPEANFAQHPDFAKLIDTDTDINDGIFNTILAAEDLVDFNVEEWFSSPTPPTYTNAARSIGLRRMVGISIKLGNENIAVMNFRKDGIDSFSIHRPLFKSICSQIAIALSNVMANDEITRQLIEIERYKQQLEEEKIYLREEIENTQNYSEIIGSSKEMKKVFQLISQVAATDSTVLLLGETGTGKELIARAIHNSSLRRSKLMIKINCAALPPNLIESELFGHERGSFTGAVDRRIGKFELAHNGTLLLDEIGEMPLELQSKLLRALQEKEIERIGGKATIKTDVRIIAATNRNLKKWAEEGKFRTDLYYRLNIFPIQLPPLRDRKEDISELAMHFIKRFSKKTGKNITSLSKKVLEELKGYSWPGNIRELEHLIERSVLLTSSETIKDVHLPKQIDKIKSELVEENHKIQTIFENEKSYILKILTHVNGRIAGEGGAAELLGIPPSTLNSRMKRLGIKREFHG